MCRIASSEYSMRVESSFTLCVTQHSFASRKLKFCSVCVKNRRNTVIPNHWSTETEMIYVMFAVDLFGLHTIFIPICKCLMILYKILHLLPVFPEVVVWVNFVVAVLNCFQFNCGMITLLFDEENYHSLCLTVFFLCTVCNATQTRTSC